MPPAVPAMGAGPLCLAAGTDGLHKQQECCAQCTYEAARSALTVAGLQVLLAGGRLAVNWRWQPGLPQLRFHGAVGPWALSCCSAAACAAASPPALPRHRSPAVGGRSTRAAPCAAATPRAVGRHVPPLLQPSLQRAAAGTAQRMPVVAGLRPAEARHIHSVVGQALRLGVTVDCGLHG